MLVTCMNHYVQTYRMNFHREKLYRLMGLNRMRIDSKRTKERLQDIDLLSYSDK